MMKFIINNQEFDIRIKELEEKIKNMTPKKTFKNMHSVEINGRLFPLKEPIVMVTGLSAVDIPMVDAYLILEKLGYPISFHH